ncbi:hypothetical protein C0J52_27149, partial [Blattella germanica]
SHHSASYTIPRKAPLSPDCDPILVDLEKKFGEKLTDFLIDWVADKPGSQDIFIIQRQYGENFDKLLEEINNFLSHHAGEIIILNIRDYHISSPSAFSTYTNKIETQFNKKLCPRPSHASEVSVQRMKDSGHQVIVISHTESEAKNRMFWPASYWPTAWPGTPDVRELFKFLEKGLDKRSPDKGYVTEAMLSPNGIFIVLNVLSNRKEALSEICNEQLIPWLKQQTPGPKGINVVICDFVSSAFCKTVVDMNKYIIS